MEVYGKGLFSVIYEVIWVSIIGANHNINITTHSTNTTVNTTEINNIQHIQFSNTKLMWQS